MKYHRSLLTGLQLLSFFQSDLHSLRKTSMILALSLKPFTDFPLPSGQPGPFAWFTRPGMILPSLPLQHHTLFYFKLKHSHIEISFTSTNMQYSLEFLELDIFLSLCLSVALLGQILLIPPNKGITFSRNLPTMTLLCVSMVLCISLEYLSHFIAIA